MKIEIKNQIIKSLILIKDELDKRNEIYKYGVDLSNYENNYLTGLIDLLTSLLGEDSRSEIEWWVFESVEKIYYYDDGPDVNVESAEDFVNYLIKGHN